MEERLACLTHAELVGLAAEACRTDAAVRAKADTLIAAAAPMPSWIQDKVLFSRDLMPMLIRCCMSTRHYEHPLGAVASVCHLWYQVWNRLLREEPVVSPLRESALPPWKDIRTLNARVVLQLPNGCLCIGTEDDTSQMMKAECCQELRVFSPEAELLRTVDAVTDIVAVARYGEVVFVAHHAGAWGEGSIARFSLDFDLLGEWPLDDVFGPLGVKTRMHQMACTQHALCMTDPDKVSILQTATGNVIGTALQNTLPSAVAADDESFYVSCLSDHSVKRLNADGEILRSFQGSFHYPTELAVLNGSLFLVESRLCMVDSMRQALEKVRETDPIKDDERRIVGRRLFVLDLPSGSQRQILRLEHVIDSFSVSDEDVGICALGVNLGLYHSAASKWALLHVTAPRPVT